MNSFKTVKKERSAEFTEKKSVFIGSVKPVFDEASALGFVGHIKKKQPGASHYAYAYIIGEGNITRFSDDGEPQSTAGMPALSVLQKNGLINAAVVVTRYFGGILLGAGGLARSYAYAARLAVDEAGIAVYENHAEFEVICAYADYDKLEKYVKSQKCVTDSAEFGESVILSLAVKQSRFEEIRSGIIDLTNGKSKITKKGERFCAQEE